MTFSSLVHLSWGEYLETLIEAVLGACHRGRNRVGTVPGGATWSNEERGIELLTSGLLVALQVSPIRSTR